jgi:hypothetical protein
MNENPNTKDIFTRLATPFHPDDIEWRAGATNNDKNKALALAYITSRAVMDRLDEVLGPENWKDEYAPGPDGGVICGLSLRIGSEWITKWDGAENTEFEAIKGGLSDAFKRAGYKWGIGRYLYRLESQCVPCELHGKTIVLKATPPLPPWALPDEWRAPSGPVMSHNTTTGSQTLEEREQQILKELGFEEQPTPEPVPVSMAPVSPKPSVSNGNGSASKSQPAPAVSQPQTPPSQPNGKRLVSWNADLVKAVLNTKLSTTIAEAVRLLNESGLPANASPEQAVTRIREMRKG